MTDARHALRTKASATALLEIRNTSHIEPKNSGTETVVKLGGTGEMAFMDGKSAALAKCRHPREFVQAESTQAGHLALTPEQVIALKQIRRVPAPFTTSDVARFLGWSPRRAERWLATFRAKGILDASRAGHTWRAA